jgi:hypothetical protein
MIVWTINIMYGPNEETDMCVICQSQLNTRFALGKFECGHCKNKFHRICLVGWAKKTREFQDHCDVSNVLVHYKPDQDTHMLSVQMVGNVTKAQAWRINYFQQSLRYALYVEFV